jgi:hypothetical protein
VASAYVRLMRRLGLRLGEVLKDSMVSLGFSDQKRFAIIDAYELYLTWVWLLRWSTIEV